MPTTVRARRGLRAPAHGRKHASGRSRSNVGTGPHRTARFRRSAACRSLPSRRCTSEVTVARYYDPQTAQFLTRDPLEAQTRSAYGYVGGDPLDGSDPSGLDWLDDTGNWAAGFGDTVTFGGTKQIRRLINYEANGDTDDMVDHCSDFYRWGGHGGAIASTGVGGAEYLTLRAARAAYVARAAEIANTAADGRSAVAARNALKQTGREGMPGVVRGWAEGRNIGRYGNPLGPAYAQQLVKYGSDEAVIAAAGRTNTRINRFFLLF